MSVKDTIEKTGRENGMSVKATIEKLGLLAAALGTTLSVCYLLKLRGFLSPANSLLMVAVFAGAAQYYNRALLPMLLRTGKEKRSLLCASTFSLLFAFLFVAGYELQYRGYTSPGLKGKAGMLVRGAFLALLLLPAINKFFSRQEPLLKQREAGKKAWKGWQVFAGSLLAIWCCWIPVWLAYYPIIMSYDFHRQSLEALWGPQYFDTHHPLAHTWLIYMFRCLGESLGSYESGYAWFSLLQQCVSVLVLAYACVLIYRLTARKWILIVSVLFFGTFPLISVMVMCTTKDVLFGAFFLLFFLVTLERMKGERAWMDVLWVLSGILMMLFRNNASYAMALFGAFFFLQSRGKERVRAFVLALLLIAGGTGALLALELGFDASKGGSIEKYSLIYQSMARVGHNQSNTMSPETHQLLDTYVTEDCWESYNPVLADTIKMGVQHINIDEKKSWDNMAEVLKAWTTIGMRYPNDYLDAFLDLTRGYWFMDDTAHAEMLGTDKEERMGLLYTYNSAAAESLPGMQHLSQFPWLEERLESVLTENCYYSWPVLSMLFKPALWCWLFVLAGFFFWCRRSKKGLVAVAYPLSYFMTMLLGPTAIVRYVYPFILCAPVLVVLMVTECMNPGDGFAREQKQRSR